MNQVIGVLLPRSTDHPSFGFDILDGLRLRLAAEGLTDVRLVPENIGFGEDKKDVYAKAEKLLIQDDAFCIIGYLSPANAELLYPLLQAAGRSLIALDPGMNYHTEPASAHVVHISLQGILSAYLAGKKAGSLGKVIMATSFYDGGYRGPWAYNRGISDAGGSIVHHYISHYKEAEFTIHPFIEAVNNHSGSVVGACFSTYLSSLFVNKLNDEDGSLPQLDFYCSSYMLEEQTMAGYNLPSMGNFYAFVPWGSAIDNKENSEFKAQIKDKKNKDANLFHLLGWEAGIVAALFAKQLTINAAPIADLLKGASYYSPRGVVRLHPDNHHAYGPMYLASMRQPTGQRPMIEIVGVVETEEVTYKRIMDDQPEGTASGWLNQYLCS